MLISQLNNRLLSAGRFARNPKRPGYNQIVSDLKSELIRLDRRKYGNPFMRGKQVALDTDVWTTDEWLAAAWFAGSIKNRTQSEPRRSIRLASLHIVSTRKDNVMHVRVAKIIVNQFRREGRYDEMEKHIKRLFKNEVIKIISSNNAMFFTLPFQMLTKSKVA